MSNWETIVLTAVAAALAGAVTGAWLTRRRLRLRARKAGWDLRMMQEVPVLDDQPVPLSRRRRRGSPLARLGIWGLTARDGLRAVLGAARRRLRRTRREAPAGASPPPPSGMSGDQSSAAASTAPELRALPGGSGTALPPPVPTVKRRPEFASGELSGQGRAPLARTPALQVHGDDTGAGLATLAVTTAAASVKHPLPDQEGLRIGPEPADVVVPELSTELLLGRNGFVWTVQVAGPADPAVTLDGVPLTSVALPWTSNRRLRAGAITLTLENAPPARIAFEEPATDDGADLTETYAARANAYALAIGVGDGSYAGMLATAAVAAFDPRLLDPARGAALGALNVTLAVRDSRRTRSDVGEEGFPLIAIVGMDASGELRAATNFDVSVWAITRSGVVLLSSAAAAAHGTLEVIPLDVRPVDDLGDRPVLLLAAGAQAMTIGHRLNGATAANTSPERLVRVAAGPPGDPAVAAAAILDRPLRGGTGNRWPG
jgi:hypothetical protein